MMYINWSLFFVLLIVAFGVIFLVLEEPIRCFMLGLHYWFDEPCQDQYGRFIRHKCAYCKTTAITFLF